MIRLILNDQHLAGVLGEALAGCRRRLFIATADVKDVHIPAGVYTTAGEPRRKGSKSIMHVFRELSDRGVEVRLLHSGVPSGPFLDELRGPLPPNFTMRRCPRLHVKAIIADGRRMYLGSANLTGAGLGAKSARRRNFEAGIWTDELDLIDPVADVLDAVFGGRECPTCGRKAHCPVPLESPKL